MTVVERIKCAVKQNLIPGIVIQVFALSLVLGYYYIPEVSSFCTGIGEFKTGCGLWFSAISTAFFGGIIPFLFLLFTRQVKPGLGIAVGCFYFFFWMWKGIEVDIFYRVQALMFGEGTDALTIIKKVAFDQFVFNVIYAVICIAVFNIWKEHDFCVRTTRSKLNREFFTQVFPTMLLSTWMVWVPATAIVYSMPSPLQIPLFNLALCFYVLLIAFITTAKKDEVVGTEA